MIPDAPIDTVPLFPELSRRFIALLEDLSPADWERPVSPTWRVREVVAHLLDSSLRRLSIQRDGHTPRATAPSEGGYATLLDYLNRLNAEWVRAMERVSPRVLIDLLRRSDQEFAAFFATLDPQATAIWPVAWAGETESRNGFDVAREYTEKWHHAQQVFEATARPSTITGRALMYPCLDALMRALPHGLRACDAPPGAAVRVSILGEAGGEWTAFRDAAVWRLGGAENSTVVASVSMRQDEAWKILMKRLPAAEIRSRYRSVKVSGDEGLCNAVLEMVCVMA